jgi:transcriptional regulator NrdR family protein
MTRGRPPACPYCGGSSIGKGVRKTKTMGIRRIRQCKSCRRKFTPKQQSNAEEPSTGSNWVNEEANSVGP